MSNNPTRYIKSIAHQPVDPGIHGQIVDSMSATTDKRGNAPSIRMAMSNGLPAGAIVEYTGNEVPDGYRRRDDIPTLSELNDNLSGFKFYPIGTQIVGLIADDSAYTDANGNYVVWGTPTAEQLVEDNPNTYKAIASTEDTRGKVGADTGIPFSNTKIFDLLPETITIRGYANQTNTETLQGFGIPTMGVYKTCTFKCTAGRVGTNTAYFKKYFLNNGVIESTTIYIANGSSPTIDISDAIYIDVVADDYNTGRAYNYIFTLSK